MKRANVISPKRRRSTGAATATIHDVAARAKVSVATVSRVLNQKDVVREETTRTVLSAVKALQYVPNLAARSLSSRRTQTIGVVLPEVHGEFFSEVIGGVDLASRRAGYHLLVSGSHSDAGEMINVLRAMRGRVDGLLVMAPDITIATLREHLAPTLPVVLLNSSDESHDAITVDNFGGAKTMMRHLFELSHERIAFIKGPPRNIDAAERLRGYRQSMRAAGSGGTSALEFEGSFTESSGYEAAKLIIAANPRPTALFAANDSMAVGALALLAEKGISIPSGMTVVGFDDIRIAHYVTPALTTVRVDIAELGRRSFVALVDSIEHNDGVRPRHERIATTLVVRQSCGPASIQFRVKHRQEKRQMTSQEER